MHADCITINPIPDRPPFGDLGPIGPHRVVRVDGWCKIACDAMDGRRWKEAEPAGSHGNVAASGAGGRLGDAKNLSWLVEERGVEPHIADVQNRLALTAYDDRRMDVIGPSRPALSSLYRPLQSVALMRSLQRQLHEDDAGRRVTDPAPVPLFADRPEDGAAETGTIYVLRSESDHPFVAGHRAVVHKIGVTSGSVQTRISGAEKSSTYLIAGVDVVASYKVYGVNCQKLESLLHKVFAAAQLDLTIPDRFGHMVKPREWFVVPLQVINDAVERIRDRSITTFRYSPNDGKLVRADE